MSEQIALLASRAEADGREPAATSVREREASLIIDRAVLAALDLERPISLAGLVEKIKSSLIIQLIYSIMIGQ